MQKKRVDALPDIAVMQCEKVAISVKGRRRLRPSKDFVITWLKERVEIKKNQIIYSCEVCGKEASQKASVYKKSKHHYCSVACKAKAQENKIRFNCDFCGKETAQKESVYRKSEHHYCCHNCSVLDMQRNHSEVRTCEICSKDFVCVNSVKQRFCSVDCQHAWQKLQVGRLNPRYSRIEIKCEWCNKSFDAKRYKLQNGQHNFCSKECRESWYSKVWSQSEDWKEESRDRAIRLLKEGKMPKTNTTPQIIVNEILSDLGIDYVNEYRIENYSVDNYIVEYDLAIEVMGDYWHCSPVVYESPINSIQTESVIRDIKKQQAIESITGHHVLYLWEKDIIEDRDKVSALIKYYIDHKDIMDDYNSFNYETESNGSLIYKYEYKANQDMTEDEFLLTVSF